MTNGDRIRRMTGEELIKMLEYHRSYCELSWLQQDAEDE